MVEAFPIPWVTPNKMMQTVNAVTFNGRNNINVLTSHVVVACGLSGSGTVSEVALAVKAGRPVILVEASPAEVAFFRKLGGRLVSAAASPEEAIDLIMRQMERRTKRTKTQSEGEYDELAL